MGNALFCINRDERQLALSPFSSVRLSMALVLNIVHNSQELRLTVTVESALPCLRGGEERLSSGFFLIDSVQVKISFDKFWLPIFFGSG